MWTYIVVEKSKVCAIHKVLRISIKLEGTYHIMKWSVKDQKDELGMVCFKEKEK